VPDRPLKIIHVIARPSGDAFANLREMISAQHNAKHEIGLISGTQLGNEIEEAALKRLEMHLLLGSKRVDMSGSTPAKCVLPIRKLLISLRPDIVHFHGAKAGNIGRLSSSVSGYKAKRIYSPHGDFLRSKNQKMERFLLRFTDQIIFSCEYEQEAFKEHVGEFKTEHAVVPYALNEYEFQGVNLNPNASDFLYYGDLTNANGLDLFIKALSQTAASAVIVGEGAEQHRFEAMARGLDVANRVTFLPTISLRNAFSMASCVVFPARQATLQIPMLKAIAARKDVIACDIGAVAEITEIAPIITLPAGNYHILAEQLSAYLEAQSPGDLLTLKSHGLKARYGIEAANDLMLDAYLK